MKISDQIENELYLNMYLEWQPGYYKSSKGLVLIEDMNIIHIQNALNSLKKSRELRARFVENILESDSDILDNIRLSYYNHQDLLSLKIKELEEEIETRK